MRLNAALFEAYLGLVFWVRGVRVGVVVVLASMTVLWDSRCFCQKVQVPKSCAIRSQMFYLAWAARPYAITFGFLDSLGLLLSVTVVTIASLP